MIHKKRFVYPAAFALLSCGALAVALHAENPDGGGGNSNSNNNNPPRPHHGPPPMPLFDALDTNHDGIISADEITNASTALKALLKDGATQITREDLRPPRPSASRDDDDARLHPRAHRLPPRDEQNADEATPPRPPDHDDRAERPHHRPPPPDAGPDREDERPHPRMDDDDQRPRHRPPPPPGDED